MKKSEDTKRPKYLTVTLLIIFFALGALVVAINIQKFYESTKEYTIKESLFSFPNTVTEYVGINEGQIVRMTKDGITAYGIEGNEIWSDTLTLEKAVVKQREPYLAVSNINGSTIHLFSEKGREAEINLQAPVVYFSINKNGYIAVIEELEDGHRISAYDQGGNVLSGARVTYADSAGYPISVEVSNDGSMLIASYVDIYNPQVTSLIVGMPLEVGREEQKEIDNISYGIESIDNIVYDIEFITDDVWVALGDERISYHQLEEGKEVAELPPTQLLKSPYVEKQSNEGYLPIIGKYLDNNSSTFTEQFLWIYDVFGEMLLEKELDRAIDFYRADEKGVIIGYGHDYEGYDALGRQRFTFSSTYNIECLGYIGHELVAITRNDAYKLEVKEQETIQ